MAGGRSHPSSIFINGGAARVAGRDLLRLQADIANGPRTARRGSNITAGFTTRSARGPANHDVRAVRVGNRGDRRENVDLLAKACGNERAAALQVSGAALNANEPCDVRQSADGPFPIVHSERYGGR